MSSSVERTLQDLPVKQISVPNERKKTFDKNDEHTQLFIQSVEWERSTSTDRLPPHPRREVRADLWTYSAYGSPSSSAGKLSRHT